MIQAASRAIETRNANGAHALVHFPWEIPCLGHPTPLTATLISLQFATRFGFVRCGLSLTSEQLERREDAPASGLITMSSRRQPANAGKAVDHSRLPGHLS